MNATYKVLRRVKPAPSEYGPATAKHSHSPTEPREGFEPPTNTFVAWCSIRTELPGRDSYYNVVGPMYVGS